MKVIDQFEKEGFIKDNDLENAILFLYDFDVKISSIKKTIVSDELKRAAENFKKNKYDSSKTETDNWRNVLQENMVDLVSV